MRFKVRCIVGCWRHKPWLPSRAGAPSRNHVTHVTVIAFESASLVDRKDADFLTALVESGSLDAAQCRRIEELLPQRGSDTHTSRTGFLEALRSLKFIHENAGASVPALDSYWEVIESHTDSQVRCLLSRDVAEAMSILAACDRRCPELVRLLHQHCRRLIRSFTAEDVSLVARAVGDMGWRSRRTTSALRDRFVSLLHSPDLAPTVGPGHLAAMVGMYPRLELTWRMGKNESKELELWKAVAVAVPPRKDRTSPREFTVILNSFASMDLSFSAIHKNVDRMFEICATQLLPMIELGGTVNGESFLPRDFALIANAYAKVRAGPYVLPLLQIIGTKSVAQMDSFNHQDVANILNAFAKLDVMDSSLFEAAALAVLRSPEGCNTQDLANIAHAYARQHFKHIAVFNCIADMSVRLMDKFKPLHLGALAYAFGRVRVCHKTFVSRLRDEVIYRGTVGKTAQSINDMHYFGLRSIEQLSNGFSSLQMHDQRLFFVIFDMARQRTLEAAKSLRGRGDTSRAQQAHNRLNLAKTVKVASLDRGVELPEGRGLSTLLAAFANSRADFRTLLQWAPRQIAELQGQFSTQDLASIFNSCTRLGLVDRELYKGLLGHAAPRIPQMTPKVVAILVRGMAKAKVFKRTFMREAVKTVSPRLGDLGVVDVGCLLVGCAEMSYRDERFLRLLAAVVRAKAEEMSPSQLATAFYSFSQMRILHPKWFDEILFELFKRQHELTEKLSTNVLYGMVLIAAVERHHAADCQQLMPGSFETLSLYPFDKHHGIAACMLEVTNKSRRNLIYPAVFQLQTTELFLRLVVPEVYRNLRQELKLLLAKARKVNLAVDDYMQNSSRMHRKISKWFTRVGLHHRSEVLLGPFFLDMVIGERFIVEIDGPSHFYRDTNSRTASALLKTIVLTAMGFRVKHLPYQEWNQCGTPEKRTLYCSSFWRDVLATDDQERTLQQLPLVDIVEMVMSSQRGDVAALGEDEPAFYTEEGLPGTEDVEPPQRAGHNPEAEKVGTNAEAAAGQAAGDAGDAGAERGKAVLRALMPRHKRRAITHSRDAGSAQRAAEEDTDESEEEGEGMGAS